MADWKKVLTEQDIDTTTTLGTSDVKVPSQNAVKTYVDAQVDTADTLAELGDTTIATPAGGDIIVYDGTDSFDNVAVSGDAGLASNGALTINDDAITYAKMQDIVTGNRVLGAISAGTVAEVQVQTAMIADDAVTSAKLDTNIDIAGTLDVTGNATFDANVTVTGDLTVNGSTTTISTTELEVQDKTIRLGAPDSVYGSDALASTGASGGGIFLESSTSATENTYARLLWDENAKLSGWKVADTGTSTSQSTAYEIATMSFSDNSTAPSTDLNGIGGLHFDSGNDTLYIRVA
jgi:hypothetical protein